MKKDTKDAIVGIFWLIVVMLIIGGSCSIGAKKSLESSLSRSEIAECKRWSIEATKMNDYYITEWQLDQCNRHGLDLSAPIYLITK